MRFGTISSFALCVSLAFGCGDDDGTTDPDAAVGDDAGTTDDAGPMACMPVPAAERPEAPAGCMAAADDYAPCEDDAWPECVSDGNEYVRIQDSISTIARVRGFEEIAELLFDPTSDPSSDDFLMARGIYQEEEGLDSRVVRRYDPHFEVPEGTDCTLEGSPEMFPDYCVGPSTLQPILLDAFMRGIDEEAPARIQAARIEGALLWFLYASTYKEAFSCTTTAKDCDSAYAYYAGGEEARGGIGLARYVREVAPYAHDRAWDGIFAVRCWRDLDDADTATMLDLRDRARAQHDRAVLTGVARIVAERLREVGRTSGDEQLYHWAFVQVLGQALDRGYTERDGDGAAALRDALSNEAPSGVDPGALADAIDATFDCA